MRKPQGPNSPVDYLLRNPTFLRRIREATFPHAGQPRRKRIYSRAVQSLEKEYGIRLPACEEFSSFQECLELIRRRNASWWCEEPVFSTARLTAEMGMKTGRRPRDGRGDEPDTLPLEEGGQILLRLDLEAPRQQVLTQVGVWYDVFSEIRGFRKFRRNRGIGIDDLTVWDEFLLERSFTRIARKYRWKPSAVRRAYYRAFVRIMGEAYNPAKHSRRKLTREQIGKTCETCADNPSMGGHCRSLCPPVLAYVDQDKRSSPFVSGRAESVTSPERSSPVGAYERRHFLRLISRITGKKFASVEEALEDLDKRDLARLRNDPRISAEYL